MHVAKNGVVVASEKRFPTALVDTDSVHKVYEITKHIGVVYSGTVAMTTKMTTRNRSRLETTGTKSQEARRDIPSHIP